MLFARHGLTLTWSRPPGGPAVRHAELPGPSEEPIRRVRNRCVAIIDYNFDVADGEEGHWTCVERVTARTMKPSTRR